MTIALQSGLVYGPVASRRLGQSLGVNVLPAGTKTCDFNCIYCQYGWTQPEHRGLGSDGDWPTPAAVADALADALRAHARVDRITLAGNGEPTLHPQFGEIVERLRDVRTALAPEARLAILSNSSTVNRPEIGTALARLDECYMKLDGGDTATLRRLNAAHMHIEDIVEPLSRLSGVVLQSMFVRDSSGRIDNSVEAAVAPWLAAVERIKPLAVHVYSIARNPAWTAVEAIPRRTLERIASRVEQLGIAALVF
jgi:wyosine [tRNA(Phe)-imidazoG37] synthetase (radical SAM superfamily)